MLANKNSILNWTITRKILNTLAETIANCELDKVEISNVINIIKDEMDEISKGKINSECWQQAISEFKGIEAYYLEKMGLLAKKEPSDQ